MGYLKEATAEEGGAAEPRIQVLILNGSEAKIDSTSLLRLQGLLSGARMRTGPFLQHSPRNILLVLVPHFIFLSRYTKIIGLTF